MKNSLINLIIICFFSSVYSQEKDKHILKCITPNFTTEAIPFNSKYVYEAKWVNTSNEALTNVKSFISSLKIKGHVTTTETINPNDTITAVIVVYNITKQNENIAHEIVYNYKDERIVSTGNEVTVNLIPAKLKKNTITIDLGEITYENTKTAIFSIDLQNKALKTRQPNYNISNYKVKYDIVDGLIYHYGNKNNYKYNISIKNIWGDSGSFEKKIIYSFKNAIEPCEVTIKGSFSGKVKDTTRYRFITYGDRENKGEILKFIYKKGIADSILIPTKEELKGTIDGPIIKFDSTTINYGIIKEDSDGVRYFTFTNIGNEPLVIKRVRSSCSCALGTWTRELIHPGKKGSIKMSYDTRRIGKLKKSLTVYSNCTNENPMILRIKGEVTQIKKD
jgi:hypothetical protein